MTESNDKMKEDILLARRMFFAGCLGLPWLWLCNALYFRLRVFGPMVVVDYWPGKSPSGGGGGEETARREKMTSMGMAVVVAVAVAGVATTTSNGWNDGREGKSWKSG